MKLIWHYTTIAQLDTMISDQYIKPTGGSSLFQLKPVIWFSKNPIWGPTTYRIQPVRLDLEEAKAIEKKAKNLGLARIGIESTNKLKSWSNYKIMTNRYYIFYAEMEEIASVFGAKPKDWYCSFSRVNANAWRSVEIFIGGHWESIGTLGHGTIVR